MASAVRRVVTGHRPDGRSAVLFDGDAPNVTRRAAGNTSTLLWVTEETPADLEGAADRAERTIGVPPPVGGSLFRIIELPPGTGAGEHPDNETMLRNLGIAQGVLRGHAPRHPTIHRTHTLDYVVVLEGEVVLLLDEGEVLLRSGEVVVQQGTNHGWVNRGGATCRLAMVFIDAVEPGVIQQLANQGDK